MKMIRSFSKNKVGRDFAVGDIHGHFSKLKAQLESIGFDAEKDRLFSVGDLVDRGPECDQVLDWIGEPWFHAVQGNHEDMAIRWPKGQCVDGNFVRNMDVGHYMGNGGAWNIANPIELQQEISQCLSVLPLAIEVETDGGVVVIIHADVYGDTWAGFKELVNSGSREAKAALDHAIWSRERIDYYDETPISDVRAVVAGHTPLKAVEVLGNTYFIDTMGWRGRDFTLLDLATLQPVLPIASE